MDALLKLVRDATQLDIKRGDIKADMLSPHHLMHLRVVDEHGRQLGAGRSLAALKGELGAKARGAFQALAALKLPASSASGAMPATELKPKQALALDGIGLSAAQKSNPKSVTAPTQAAPAAAPAAAQRHTTWAFGELPELMEIKKGGQTLVGFPALIDQGDAVTIEVFDEPTLAADKHRAGLRRLFALQIKDALKYLEKTCPACNKWAWPIWPWAPPMS
jgi:ATP-dependent helicase HrpA